MNKIKIIFCCIFIAFISTVGICTLDNKNDRSRNEKRTLTMFPSISYKSLLDTDYLDTISNAVSDQLELRSKFVNGYNKLNIDIFKQTYIGSIVVGRDQVLFNEPMKVKNWETYKKNVKAGCEETNKVAKVARDNGTKLIVIDIPRKDIVLRDYVPSYYPDNSKEYLECLEIQKSNLVDDVAVIDVYSLFQENRQKDDSIYFYYNDHHINAFGNELILTEIMNIVHEDYPDIEQYKLDRYHATYKRIYGAFNRKIGLAAEAPDEILYLEPNGWSIPYTRMDNGVLSETPILSIDTEANSYASAYMGGNYGETIVSTNREELPSIFYCGSSFTNALEAMSVPSFDNMYSVDFRHNESENTLSDYIQQWKPEYVVLINGQSTGTFKIGHIMTHLGLKKD